MNSRGFTLIEVIVTVVVLAFVMYALVAIFISAGYRGVNVEVYTVAQSLAEDKLEEAMVQNFGGVTDESETSFSGDLSEFSYEITTGYVSAEALDSMVGYATDFKKIQVRVRHPQLVNPTVLESVKANY
jgi:prepilin-type N-terminal cleavage/methylation domain-containing protein